MKVPEVVRHNDNVRVVVRTAAELFGEGTDDKGNYAGGKWGGLYLRAPDIFFRILEKAGDKLVRLGDVADVRFGIKTGANDFFYLEVISHRPVCPLCGEAHEGAITKEEEVAYWKGGKHPPEEALVAVRNGLGWEGYLEASTLRPLFKSPREAPALKVDVANLGRVFLPKSDERERLPPHAQGYVSYGEKVPIRIRRGRNRGRVVRGVPSLSTVQARDPWWWIGAQPEAEVILPMFERARKYAFWNPSHAAVDNALYLVLPLPEVDPVGLLSALNSTAFGLFKEVLARPPEGGGGGPLQIKVYQYEAIPLPSPDLFSEMDKARLDVFLRRPIRDFWEEVGLTPPHLASPASPLPDRRSLDELVFDHFGLTEKERQEVYREAARLVWSRIAMAGNGNSLGEE